MIFLKDNQDRWTVVVNGESNVFDKTHAKYNELVLAVINSDEERFVELFGAHKVITSWSEGEFRLEDGFIKYDGQNLDNVLSDYILGLIQKGVDYKPMLKFVENLQQNPSFKVVERLYQFLSHKNLPITSDGCFLAYKAVTHDFKDKRTKTKDNSVGCVVEERRNRVDDNMENECSNGLHVGSLAYVNNFADSGDKMIVCKVNPADVVAVPYADAQKLRCCKYEVVDLYEKPLDDSYDDSYDNEEEEESENDCYYCGSYYCEGECLEENE